MWESVLQLTKNSNEGNKLKGFPVMDLIGSKVKHNKFGEGIVTEQGDSYIFVKFVTEVSLKKFLYPSCFETFLKLLDATAETDETVKQQRMMLEQRGKTQYVDFDHPEFCTGTNPVSCIVEGKSFNGVNWRDILVALTEDFLQNKPAATALYRTSVYPMGAHAFLLKEKPKFSAR